MLRPHRSMNSDHRSANWGHSELGAQSGRKNRPACVCVCLSLAAFSQYCMDPDVSWGSGKQCPIVLYCWANLQSVHGLKRVLVHALCLVSHGEH